ncbi:MAG: hypothetical protein Q9157_001305 [Trypethelium eluteriae]
MGRPKGLWQALTEDDARRILYDELSSIPTKYLVIDAIDEAEGCKSSIDREIRQLRHHNVAILSTDRRDPRERHDQPYCYRCADGSLNLYWLCDQCMGHFQINSIELCQNCYKVKGLRCRDTSHEMKPPLKLNIEMKTSQQDLKRYVEMFLDDEFNGGDTGDDDEAMFGGQDTLLSMLRKKLGPDFWASLPFKVSTAADSNFLYAKLFMERLRVQPTLDGAITMVRQLDQVHGTLDNLDEQYGNMVSLCTNKSDTLASQVAYDHLALVSSAFEVLSFVQLSHARAIACGDRLLEHFSGRFCLKQVVRRGTNGLLNIDNIGEADSFPVTFFHRSLSTHIEKNQKRQFPDAHQRMFQACLAYLKLDEFSGPFESLPRLEEAVKKYLFVSCAASYWGLHAQNVSSNVENSLLILDLLNDANRLSYVMQIAWHTRSRAESSWDVSGGITPLHECAFYGLKTLCRALLLFETPVDPVDDVYNQTHLIYASRKGHVYLVKLLLDAGANPHHLSTLGRSPMVLLMLCPATSTLFRVTRA